MSLPRTHHLHTSPTMRESTHVNASSRFPRSASTGDDARGFRLPATKVALGAAVLGVSLFSATPAFAAEVTNPADNPAPITVTIDGQQFRDGLDTLPGYDDYACTPIPNVEYDFSTNSIIYYDNDNQPIKTVKWTEWDRISSYATWKKQQQAAATPSPSTSNSNSSSSNSSSSSSNASSSSGSASAPAAAAAPESSSSAAATSAPAASSSSPASSTGPSTSTSSANPAAAAPRANSTTKGNTSSSSSKGSKSESSSGGSSSSAGASAPATVAGAGSVKGAGAATATEPGKDGADQAAGGAAAGGGGGGAGGGGAEGAGLPGAINAAGNALVSGPPAPVGVTPAATSVGKVVASGAGNTRVAGLLILAVLTIAGLVLFFGSFARRAAFGARTAGQAGPAV